MPLIQFLLCPHTNTLRKLICLGLSSVVLLGSWLLFTLKYLNLFSENCAEVWQWWSFGEKILQLPVLNTVQQAIYWLLSAKGSLQWLEMRELHIFFNKSTNILKTAFRSKFNGMCQFKQCHKIVEVLTLPETSFSCLN